MVKFLKSVRDNTTDITKMLSNLFSHPRAIPWNNYGEWLAFQNQNALDPTDDAWSTLEYFIRERLASAGVVDPTLTNIISHIANWPSDHKEGLREVLAATIASDRHHPVKFKWELHKQDDNEGLEVVDADGNNLLAIGPNLQDHLNQTLGQNKKIDVTFKSPWSKVRIEAATNEVFVDVGQ